MKAVTDHDAILRVGGKVPVSRKKLSALIKRYHIKRLALFGTAACSELTPESDIDVLVKFEEDKASSQYDGKNQS